MHDHVHLALASCFSEEPKSGGSFSRVVCSMIRGAGELHDRARLGHDDVGHGGEAGEHPARGGMGEDGDVGQAGLGQQLHAARRSWPSA